MSKKAGLYEAFEGKAKEDWDQWLAQRKVYAEEYGKALDLLGASKALLHFDGSIAGIVPKKEGHPGVGWKKNPDRKGIYYPNRSRAKVHRSAAIALAAINDRLKELFPCPMKIARSHGFVCNIKYRNKGHQSTTYVGNPWEPFRPLFGVPGSPVVLCAPDMAKWLQHYQDQGYTTEPSEWKIPDGYRQISNAEWDYRVAKMKRDAELEKEAAE